MEDTQNLNGVHPSEPVRWARLWRQFQRGGRYVAYLLMVATSGN